MPNQTLYDNFSQVRQYIDQNQVDLSSYVSKSELEGMSYATTSYVVDYVAEHGGGGSTTIDENIIPKENLTYQLGDATHNYKATYTSSLKSNDSGITVQINNNNKYYISSSAIRPTTTNSVNLGTNDYYWDNTYTSNIWLNGTNKFSNRNNNQVNLMLNNAWRYVFHINNFSPANDNTINLGESSTRWKSTYTSNLYLGSSNIKDLINGMFSYDSTTGTLTITTMS